jgi:translation initiation factor IF-3
MNFKKKSNGGYNPNYNRSRSNNSYQEKKKDFGPRRNEWIRVSEVRVIDDEGENLGVIKTVDALRIAKERELDLVEVSPNVDPPVCRIIDFAKYQYELSKKSKENKHKTKEMKEFRFSPVIDQGDIDIRVRRSKEYIEKGHNVRLTMLRKGRQPFDKAKELFDEILTNFEDYSTIEPEKKVEGKSIFITFKANGKTKNKQNGSKEDKEV